MTDQVGKPFNNLFEKPLAVATATYAYSILVYLQRRTELEMKDVGNLTMTFLQNMRHVKEDCLTLYYESLTGVIHPLIRYAALEESCTKSGAYNTDRLKTLDSIHLAIQKFENPVDPKVFDYLRAMLDI